MTNNRNSRKSQNTEKSEFRPVRKTPKSRNFRPVRKHRKFDSSGRYPETLTSAPPRKRTEPDAQTRPSTMTKESWRPMQNQIPNRMSGERIQDAKPEPEGATANAVKACKQEAPEPKSPKSLKLSLTGSVERQAQHRPDRRASRGPDQCELIGRRAMDRISVD
jgi:hypothetical protein